MSMPSPLEITIGLHYWTTPTEYAAEDPDHQGSPAVTDMLRSFVKRGLLEKLPEPNEYGGTYRATDGMRVWVEALCAVPYPERIWVIPSGQGT